MAHRTTERRLFSRCLAAGIDEGLKGARILEPGGNEPPLNELQFTLPPRIVTYNCDGLGRRDIVPRRKILAVRKPE